MQDHSLFQAICRTNRLDGDDRTLASSLTTKDLIFEKVEKLGLDASGIDRNSPVVLTRTCCKGRTADRLDDALEGWRCCIEPVPPPKGPPPKGGTRTHSLFLRQHGSGGRPAAAETTAGAALQRA